MCSLRGALNPARVSWLVCFCLCTCSETLPLLIWAGLFLPLHVSVSQLHSVTHFPSLALFFPFLLPLFMSACFLLLLLLSSALSPPTGVVCIPAKRGGGVCDPASIRTRPRLHGTLPRVHPSPHPLPGKMGVPSSLAGHRLPFECAALAGSRDLTWFVCLLLCVCTKP